MSLGAESPGKPKGWWWLVLGALLVLGSPTLFFRSLSHRARFHEEPLRELALHRPACVFLGDSMLQTRLDEDRLNALAPFRCDVLSRSGSSTALWYLILKNVVAPQPVVPRWVVVFFRDEQLTMPKFRAEGTYLHRLEEYCHETEPVLDELLRPPDGLLRRGLARLPPAWRSALELERGFGAATEWPERLSLTLYPIQERHARLQRAVSYVAARVLTRPREIWPLIETVNGTFTPGRTRRDPASTVTSAFDYTRDLDPTGVPFGAVVGRSFLPPMIETARQRGISLIFVRVERLTEMGPDHHGDSPKLAAYFSDLKAYLQQQGATYLDRTLDPAVDLSFFSGDDHVVDEKRDAYTELFWRQFAPLVTAGGSPNSASR